MDFPLPERRRVQTTYGLDVAFPASNTLRGLLSQLATQYYEQSWKLAEFAAFAQPYVQKSSAERCVTHCLSSYLRCSVLIALGKPGHLDDDVWCLDTRGILTLAVCKTSYERLGLIGRALPWKEHQDVYIVRISLHTQVPVLKDETCHAYGPKVKAAFQAWDQRRDPWDVIFHSPEQLTEASAATKRVKPTIRLSQNIHIPKSELYPRPNDASAAGEWDESVAELFEWVGLACLGSERLRAYDRPDPYIAVYTPPSPAYTGDVVHVRWMGLLSPQFVQSVIDIASDASFACVVANSIAVSPVTYVPSPPSLRYPQRASRAQSEDSWSVVISRPEDSDQTSWLLVESIGKWDSRWG
ncbi:uncharacterized protein PHACADRAFT_166302 [Phanerochaete carnosa HHB-10118-sp]|uniref:Uncharacterized protein n=1 Tax=Phanerochaete carnosa (strain HHB-10118-sp) TaxID=650164 RepID=K5VHA9_PHACS|nr:uncharacterized protein PHACADRAFT_166302 [Phanerochaete carnosa HHB-10118-sp]EKM50618.1 hypothetical protein PHACADRAFT_166302 [Phanerochaete carnosa HHB-10118-sp]